MTDGRPTGTCVSSEVRTDEGPGPCERLYVESLEVLGSAGKMWRTLLKVALGALLISVLGWVFLPVKFDD